MSEKQEEALRARVRVAFLGCFVGDALGRPFESSSQSDPRLGPAVDARAAKAGPWGYSDDTEMMLSVAESLLRRRQVDPEDLLKTMAANYDPARGYGKGMKLVFRALEQGLSWKEASHS